MIDFITKFAEHFMGLFQEGGAFFVVLVVDIVPMLIVLLTLINAILAGIGEERVINACGKLSKYAIARWLLLPLITLLIMMTPAAFTFGRFIPNEQHKVGFFDCVGTFCHPITGMFPHANAGEYFLFTGVASGLVALGISSASFGVWYFVTGCIVSLFRGFFTELFYKMFASQAKKKSAAKEVQK